MSLTIDCGTCTRQYTSTCEDCVVTYLVTSDPSRQSPGAVVIDVAEFSALRRLNSGGLIPDLLHDGLEQTG